MNYQRKKKQKQKKFAIKSNQMMLEETEKPKSTQINDKRYYFSDGIVLLPFSHPFLLEIVKREKQKIGTILRQEKHKLI